MCADLIFFALLSLEGESCSFDLDLPLRRKGELVFSIGIDKPESKRFMPTPIMESTFAVGSV